MVATVVGNHAFWKAPSVQSYYYHRSAIRNIHGCSTRLQLLHASLVALSPEPFTDFNLATLRLHGMSWGVKTTCFKAPGVSLGGSGVSIGGVRILSVS